MYITITDIEGEKTIGLSYPIQNFSSSKEAPAPWRLQLLDCLVKMFCTG